MINKVEFNGKEYPGWQAKGFAARFIFPFAKEVCTGFGYDIGCNRKEWALDGSYPIDLNFNDGYDAFKLPKNNVDYIFSSHCLEHIPNWVDALDYWTDTLTDGGVLFLYLPHYDQEYWRPFHNRKHVHSFDVATIRDYMVSRKYSDIFFSERDLNHSFSIFGKINKNGNK